MGGYEPTTILGLVGLIILVLGGALVATLPVAIPLWLSRRNQKNLRRDVNAVRDQVQNNHSTNLRDDIDEISRAIWGLSTDISGLHSDVRGLRDEVRAERTDRIAADERISEHITLEIQRHPTTD